MESNWRELEQVVGELLDLPEVEVRSRLEHSGVAPEIRLRAAELLRAWRDSEGFLDPPVLASPPEPDRLLGERLGSWRLTAVIGSGGMGTVYSAERDDHDFAQRAAVKVIAAGRLSRSTERRFREERQILARLEHPLVARLIDGGVAPDGSPYLVMEYVEGTPIDVWARGVDLRERLRMLCQVCEAVQFAHQNLVVHCDLKPANILVTGEGTPKLLDFGIARFLESDGAETRTLLHPMTPDYASPEQVRGLPPGTASDIYSLGVLLHELLTGRRPYRLNGMTLEQVLATVCEKEIERPATGSADLDAIILKALHKDPLRRYGSAEGLAADVRCYLEGRPVSARPDSFFYRARKFAVRRAIPLAAACAVFVAVLAGALSTMAQSRRAERRFNDVRDLAHSLMFDVYNSMSAAPGTLAARQLVAGQAQQYLDRLARDAAGDSGLALDLGLSYLRLGDVRGGPYAANLGDTAGALENYRKAEVLLEREALRRPNDSAVQEALFHAHLDAGRALNRMRNAGAVATLRRATAEAEAMAARHPQDRHYIELLSQACVRLGEALGTAAGQTGPVETYQEALAIDRKSLQVLEAAGQSDRAWQVIIGSRYFGIGYALWALGDRTGDPAWYQQALQSHLKGDAINRAIAERDPEWANGREFADGRATLGLSRWKCCRDAAGALRDLRYALSRFQRIADAEPENIEARRDLCNVYQSIGTILSGTGRRKEALEAHHKALRILEELGRTDPGSGENALRLAEVRALIAALNQSP